MDQNCLTTTALAALFAVAPPSPASESAGQNRLPAVISEAPRQIGSAAHSAGQNTSEFDEADIGIAHERTVGEVLRGHPGLVAVQAGGNGLGAIYLRGAGGQGLLTLDGLPVPDSVPGVINLNALIPDGLETIQVSRGFGPASQPFSALGGAIRMASRHATHNSADLRVEGGSFGFLKETARGTYKGEQGRLAITASRSDAFDGAYVAQQAHGNNGRNPFHGNHVMANADFDVSDALGWEGSLLYRDAYNSTDRLGRRNNLPIMLDDTRSFYQEELWMAQNSLKARITDDWLTRLQLGYTHKRLHGQFSGLTLAYQTDFYLARWENEQKLWRGIGKDAVHLVWGVDTRHENANGLTFNNLTFAPSGSMTQGRSQQAGFVETRFVYGKLSGDVGVRFEGYDRYKDHALFHAGAAYRITPEWTLRGNGGNGFRIPSFTDRLYPLVGNLDLKPERGTGGDLGLEWRPSKQVKLDLTGFYSRYDDLMIVTWNPRPSLSLPCIQCDSNLANASIAGLETSGEATFNEQWRGGASYTYTDSRNLATDRRVPLRPRDTVRLWGEWRMSTLPVSLWAEGVYRGQTYSDIENTLVTNGSLRVNARLNYQLSPKLGFYVRGENLTGNRTPEFYGFDYPGAAVYGGVELKL